MLEIGGNAFWMTVYAVVVPISGWELVKSILNCRDEEKPYRRIIIASGMGFYMVILTALLPLALYIK